MVNVDGVVHGNSRCTLAGVDPNRVWPSPQSAQKDKYQVFENCQNMENLLAPTDANVRHDPNPILHPVVFALKNHMRSLSQEPKTCLCVNTFL